MPRKAKTPMNPGRPDLPQQAVSTPTGLPYGENKALAEAQSAAPLPAVDHPRAVAAAKAMPFPSQTLSSPTERPNEPITAGLPMGAGPGPEILARPAGAPTIARTLSALAADSGDPVILRLAQLAESQNA